MKRKQNRTKASKHGRARGGVRVTCISLQLSGRLGPGLDAPPQARWLQASREQGGWQRRRTTTKGVAEPPERTAGQRHRRDSLLGHRAQGLERNAVRTSLVFSVAPFGPEPLFLNIESKTETDIHRERQTENGKIQEAVEKESTKDDIRMSVRRGHGRIGWTSVIVQVQTWILQAISSWAGLVCQRIQQTFFCR